MPIWREIKAWGAHAARQSAVFAPYHAVIASVRPAVPVAIGDIIILIQLDSLELRAQGSHNQAKAHALDAQLVGLQAMKRGQEQASPTTERLG
jgi:hypothetical protein